jgi:hypothetical protein
MNVESSLLLLITTKKARPSTGQNVTTVLKAEKEKGRYGPFMGIRKNQFAKNVIILPNILNSSTYSILTAI